MLLDRVFNGNSHRLAIAISSNGNLMVCPARVQSPYKMNMVMSSCFDQTVMIASTCLTPSCLCVDSAPSVSDERPPFTSRISSSPIGFFSVIPSWLVASADAVFEKTIVVGESLVVLGEPDCAYFWVTRKVEGLRRTKMCLGKNGSEKVGGLLNRYLDRYPRTMPGYMTAGRTA